MNEMIKHDFPGHGTIYNGDCMELLATLPDKSIDMVLTDPPYGGGGREYNTKLRYGGQFDKYKDGTSLIRRMGGTWATKYKKKIHDWDKAPKDEVFAELFRISKAQIIWGGNYFRLPPTRCFNIWRKLTISEHFTMAMCEYCWTSFNSNAKCFEFAPQDKQRFHPTQKPVALISRQLEEYASPGMTILDPFSGSGTTAIAAIRQGCRFICCEKDPDYYAASVQRILEETSQLRLDL